MNKLNLLLFLVVVIITVCCGRSNNNSKSSVQDKILDEFKEIEYSDTISLDEFCLEATPEVYMYLAECLYELNFQLGQEQDAFCISLSIEDEKIIDCRLELVELSGASPQTVTRVIIDADLETILCEALVGKKMCIDSFNN